MQENVPERLRVPETQARGSHGGHRETFAANLENLRQDIHGIGPVDLPGVSEGDEDDDVEETPVDAQRADELYVRSLQAGLPQDRSSEESPEETLVGCGGGVGSFCCVVM